MKPVHFNGLFKFKNVSPTDRNRVQAIVQAQQSACAEQEEGGQNRVTTIQWQEGDTFHIETSRPIKKAFGFLKSRGETGLLDVLIQDGLSEENMDREEARVTEQAKAKREGRIPEPQPEDIQFTFKG